MSQIYEDLSLTIERLKTSLNEYKDRAEAAEEALRAIQSGEVDALVIDTKDGERVYTLEGADQAYRVMIESVKEGVATLRPGGMVLYANQRMAEMLGIPLEKFLGYNLAHCVAPSDQNIFAGLLRKGIENASKDEITVYRRDGAKVPMLFSMTAVETMGERMICLVATDLTEQKKHAEIVASERLARSILDQASEVIIVCDTGGIIIRASQAASALLGDNPLFQPFERAFPQLCFVNKGQQEAEEFSIQAVLKGKSYQGIEVNLKPAQTASAVNVYLLLSATPLRDERDDTLGCIVSFTDITERKRAEDQIAYQARLLIHVHDAIFATDDQMRISYWNPVAEEIFGWTSAEAEGGDAAGLLQSKIPRGTSEQALQQLLEKGFSEGEVLYRRKDGMYFNAHARSATITGLHGEFKGVVTSVRDITQRVRIQSELQKSEERFKLALGSSPTSIYHTDRDLRYTWIYNPSHGFSADQIIGKTDEELLPLDTCAELVAFKRSVLESGIGARAEVHFPLNGVDNIYAVTAEPLRDEYGNIIGLTVAATDITEIAAIREKAHKDQARIEVQRRLLDQREQERQQIARDLHDGPVQELIAVSFLLQDLEFENCTPGSKDQMRLIQSALRDQISGLRNFAGELRPPALISFGLVKAIQSHVEEFMEKNPNLHIHLEENWEGPILLEEFRLAIFRIYQEALNNVARHSGAKNVTIRLKKNDRQIVLEVQDDGVGFEIPADWLDLIHHGHLGLVGMRERVEMIGGHLEVFSRPGEGTRLIVTAPIPVTSPEP